MCVMLSRWMGFGRGGKRGAVGREASIFERSDRARRCKYVQDLRKERLFVSNRRANAAV